MNIKDLEVLQIKYKDISSKILKLSGEGEQLQKEKETYILKLKEAGFNSTEELNKSILEVSEQLEETTLALQKLLA